MCLSLYSVFCTLLPKNDYNVRRAFLKINIYVKTYIKLLARSHFLMLYFAPNLKPYHNAATKFGARA